MTTLRTGIVDRVGRRTVVIAAVVVALIVAAAVTLVVTLARTDEYRITAQFVATPGLYPDNAVDILGVPTGHIVSVTPKATYVDVVIALPTSVKIPAGANAVMMAPNPVSDRFVELTPAYTHGAVMKHGATIPERHTSVPLELDQIYSSIDDLSKVLGPGGANAHGELSAALHAFAGLADGNGADLHQAIAKISAALPALTAHPDDLKKLITGLDLLTQKLVARNATINQLYDDLATATGQLADERQSLSSAIANLQRGLAQVVDFIRTNQKHIGAGIKNLNSTLAAVMSEQQYLINTFDDAPLGFQNFNRAITPSGPCVTPTGAPNNCSALWARLNVPSDAANFVATYCGNSLLYSLLPILEKNAGLGSATATHTACGAQIGLLNKRTGPPGAPKTPDLDLTHYLGSK